MGEMILSKSLIQFSVEAQGPNYGGGNEDNGDLLQMVSCTHCRTRCPRPCSRPLTHASARDAWTLTGEPGSVSRGVTAPVSWVRVHISFYWYPPRVYFPVLCKFWQIYGGVNGYLFQEGLCHTHVCFTQSPCPCGSPLLTHTSARDSWHSQTSLGQSLVGSLLLSPGSWCTRFCLCPPRAPSGDCVVLELASGQEEIPHVQG